ncbi:alpha/beta hydrolase [Blastomonas sp. AAP53]|uniref:alpha/beta hydrolase n=1 Tax=Blastomonas sp. AAP53 TaxID=1248760 RepID=UPI001EE67B02|nr:alpha/beta hydrolase [Blastomonas sp. AAP53]
MPDLRRLSALVALGAALCAGPVEGHEAGLPYIETIEITWEDNLAGARAKDRGADMAAPVLARFGPFHVIDRHNAQMRGVVGTGTPAQFAAMLRAWPDIQTLEMIDCPGSEDDAANLALGRMLRAARIATFVPAGGSVRSGAVELFLAGVRRTADSRAEFAVHSWRDELGREAADVSPDDPVHGEYIEFYREMGLSAVDAQRFYALTSSVAFDDALYVAPLHLADMGLLEVD